MLRFQYAIVSSVCLLAWINGAAAQDEELSAGAVRAPVKKLKIFELKHSPAEEMQRIVGDLFDVDQQRRGAVKTDIRTSSDTRTNTLIVIAYEADISVIEALIETVDRPVKGGSAMLPGNNISQLAKRVDRLEQLVQRLGRSGFDRSRSPRADFNRLNGDAAPQPTPVAQVAGTQIRVLARSANGNPLKVVSVAATGKRVKKGDLLLALDSTAIEENIAKLRVDANRVKALVHQAQADYENATLEEQSETAKAELQIELAKLKLAEYQEGTHPLQLMILEQEPARAKARLSARKELAKAGRVDAQSLFEYEAALQIAVTKLEVFKKFTSPRTVKELQSAVATPERELQRIRVGLGANVKAAAAKLRSLEAQTQAATAALDRLYHSLQMCNIVAPHDGVVAAVQPLPVREGSQVRSRQVVLILVKDKQAEDAPQEKAATD